MINKANRSVAYVMLKQETERTEMLMLAREENSRLKARIAQLEDALRSIAAHTRPMRCADAKALVGQVTTAYDYQFFARDELAKEPT